MARSATKRTAKAPSSSSKTPLRPSKGPPPPFELPPEKFSSRFLSTLAHDHVYIVHVDDSSQALKRQVFFVPVCINVVICLVLVCRLYYAVPKYYHLIRGPLGYPSPTVVNVEASTGLELSWLTVTRTLLLLADYLLFTVLGPWPWRFVFGVASTRNSSPLKWRLAMGFKEDEVIVRHSRNWDRSLLPDWTIDDEPTLKHKIMPALGRKYLQKTGYLLEDKDWSLDFQAITDAHSLIDSGQLGLDDFEKAVIVHYPASGGPDGGWMIWPVSKEDRPRIAAQRDSVVRFKDKLTAMGHEDLFFRWVELVQYESSSPGGFTPERQAAAMREAKRIFEDRGVDFARFWQDVGGKDGMPGLSAGS